MVDVEPRQLGLLNVDNVLLHTCSSWVPEVCQHDILRRDCLTHPRPNGAGDVSLLAQILFYDCLTCSHSPKACNLIMSAGQLPTALAPGQLQPHAYKACKA